MEILNKEDPLKYFFFCFQTASLGGRGLKILIFFKKKFVLLIARVQQLKNRINLQVIFAG